MKRDMGVVYTLAAGAILTTYTYSNAIGAGRPDFFRFEIVTMPDESTAITGLKATVQSSADGIFWEDIESTDDMALVAAIEHTWAVSGNQANSVKCDGGFNHLRIGIKVTGGVGSGDDMITVRALAL